MIAADAAVTEAPDSREDGSVAPETGASGDAAGTRDAPAIPASAASYQWRLPTGFPVPPIPAANPMTEDKVHLGRRLFYDRRLARNQTQSCASCHRQELAFTDGRAQALGSTGQPHPRSAMSLANVAYASTLTWANPLELDLEHQALVPMFGDDPIELGLTSAAEIEERLKEVPVYVTMFASVWPADSAPITLQHVVQALACFERTIISGRSPFDRWQYGGDEAALGASAKRGYRLFNSEAAECFHCHEGFNLTDHVNWAGKAFFDQPYHNTGLYNIDGAGGYPEPNTGLSHVTNLARDMGRFKAPTLRNIAVTGPYMHDGSIGTLDEVLDHYQAGGRTITGGPYSGNGALSPLKDPVIRPLSLSAQDRADILSFFQSLTDDGFLTDPALSNPW